MPPLATANEWRAKIIRWYKGFFHTRFPIRAIGKQQGSIEPFTWKGLEADGIEPTAAKARAALKSAPLMRFRDKAGLGALSRESLSSGL